jgi:two-component system sensor histidine kinase UhpB
MRFSGVGRAGDQREKNRKNKRIGNPIMNNLIHHLTNAHRLNSDDLCQALLNTFVDGLVMQNQDGVVYACNAVAASLLECSREELRDLAALFRYRGAATQDGAPRAEHAYPMNMAARLLRPVNQVLLQLAGLDGRQRWLEVSASPMLLNDDGECVGVVTFLRDMTAQIEAETAREQRHQALEERHLELERRMYKRTAQLEFTLGQLKLAVSASGTGLWNWNLRTNQLYFSPEWKRQIGYADREIGDTMEEWESRIHGEDRVRTMVAVHAYLATPDNTLECEYRMRHRDGTYRWILSRATAVLDDDGRSVLLQGSHVDITERKLAEQNLLELTRELRDVSRELARVEEAERRRFAQELHDTIGAALAALSINMTIMSGQVGGGNSLGMEARLKDSILLLDDTTDVVRRLMAELRPPVLDDYGLEAALRWQCELFAERCGFCFTVDVYGIAERLEPELEIALFRIAQGAITNIAKHAQASNVEVMLNIQRNSALLTIADDGVGFVPNLQGGQKLKPTWGLVSMRERAQALDGNMKIVSAPGGGTCIEVSVKL